MDIARQIVHGVARELLGVDREGDVVAIIASTILAGCHNACVSLVTAAANAYTPSNGVIDGAVACWHCHVLVICWLSCIILHVVIVGGTRDANCIGGVLDTLVKLGGLDEAIGVGPLTANNVYRRSAHFASKVNKA